MSAIQTIEQFLEAYKNGQQTFTDLVKDRLLNKKTF